MSRYRVDVDPLRSCYLVVVARVSIVKFTMIHMTTKEQDLKFFNFLYFYFKKL